MSYILNHMTIQCIGNAIRGSKVIGKDAWKAVKYNLSLSQQTAQSVRHAKLKDSYAKKLMHTIRRNTPSVLVASACLLQHYDFENEGISLEALERYWKDNNIDTLHGLLKTTLICPICGKRIVLNNRVPDTEYCECKASPSASPEGWQPFLERENILVWRRPDEHHPSLYSYRVYGNLPDVSVAAFVETQLNCSNRTSWDPTVIDLSVVESDGQHQDLLYWLVRFPRFFANREYIFKRRFHAYPERGELVIVSECAEEGVAPPSKGVHRVETYWSVMVVRAVDGPDPTKPGMEYMLTYFDNPGTSLPAAITNFVAYTGFPNFLANLYKASLGVQKRFEAGVEDVFTSVPKTLMELPQIKIVDEPENEFITVMSDDQYSEDIKDEISLLETMGEIGPDFDLESAIARLEFLIDNLDKSNVLFATVGQIKDKLVIIRETSKSSKRESLQIMNKFHEDRSRYDEEAPAVDVVRLFFEDMRDIMKADMDMRTGKSLARDRSEEREIPAFIGEVYLSSKKERAASDKEKCISSEIENCNASEEISSLSSDSYNSLSVGDDKSLSKKVGSSKTGTDDGGGSSVSKNSNNGDSVDSSKKSDGRRLSLPTVHALDSESRVSGSDEEIPLDSVAISSWSSYCYSIFIESPYNFITQKKSEPDAEGSEKSVHENPNDAEASSDSSEDEDSPSNLQYYTYGWIVKNWYYYVYS